MLSRPDARVVARDPSLPALARLLDPEFMLRLLERERPELGASEARCTYVRYKPGTRILAGFEVRDASGASLPVSAWGVCAADRPKLFKALGRAAAPGRSSGAEPGSPASPDPLLVSGGDLLVTFYPHDRRLLALSKLSRSGFLGEFLSDRGGRGGARTMGRPKLEILSYKPERRVVVKVTPFCGMSSTDESERRSWPSGTAAPGASDPLVLRLYTPGRFRTAFRGFRAFARRSEDPGVLPSADAFRLPSLLARSRSRHILVLDWVEGDPIADERWEEEGPGRGTLLAGAVGRGLADLHDQEAPGLRVRGTASVSSSLRHAARGVGAVSPGRTARRARLVARDLVRHLEGPPPCAFEKAPLHGDFHPDQLVISSRGRLGLLDLDRSHLGERVEDLATFMAHLERRALEGALSSSRLALLESALLAGYEASAGPVNPTRYVLHRGAALLRLAPQPFRDRTRNWHRVTRRLVSRAVELLHTLPRRGHP